MISNHSNHGETRVYTKGQALTGLHAIEKNGNMANNSVIDTNILISKTAGIPGLMDTG